MKRIFRGYIPLLLAAALAGTSARAANGPETAAGRGTNALTLSVAIQLALEGNLELRVSGARADAAAGRAQQAGKWRNPELELSAEDWPLNRGNGFADAKQLIGISQELPYPGKKSLERRIGSAAVKLSEAELAVRRTEIVRDVKAGFYRVLATEHRAEVSAQLTSVAESAALAARKRVEAGASAYQEQLRAEVQLEQARNEEADRRRELAGARQLLAGLLGWPDLSAAPLAGALTETSSPALLNAADTEWLARHPSAAAARANLERAELELRRARLETYPDVKVGAAGGRVGATDESIVQLGLSLPLPLLDGGKGRRFEARANVEAADAERLVVEQQLRREWASARARYRVAADQTARYRERLLPKAEEALRLVRTGFEEGKFSFMDLLDTQRTAAEAHLAYQEKLLELNLAQAELEALLQP